MFSMKHSYMLIAKIILGVNNWGCFIKGLGNLINGWFIGDIEYFNNTFEEYKVLYPDEASDYIRKHDFDVFS